MGRAAGGRERKAERGGAAENPLHRLITHRPFTITCFTHLIKSKRKAAAAFYRGQIVLCSGCMQAVGSAGLSEEGLRADFAARLLAGTDAAAAREADLCRSAI